MIAVSETVLLYSDSGPPAPGSAMGVGHQNRHVKVRVTVLLGSARAAWQRT